MEIGSERICPEVQALGFTQLYAPAPSAVPDEIVADVIFVHGLMGHPRKTWQYGKKPERNDGKSPSNQFWKKGMSILGKRDRATQEEADRPTTDKTCYWPFDLLPLAVKNIRVLTYGYDSHPSHFCTGPTNRMTISQHSQKLLFDTTITRADCSTRPIIFVAHSLGGILVKDAIIESRKYTKNPRMQQVYNQCRAIFFFGTPHLGAKAGEWGELITNIFGVMPIPVSTYSEVLHGLSPDSEKLEMVTKDFNDILDAEVPDEKRIKICSLREGRGLSGLKLFDGKVVPDYSASFGRRNVETSVAIEQNHMNMCRFESVSDPGYVNFKATLSFFLADMADARRVAENIRHEQQGLEQDARRAALLKSLDFAGRCTREHQLWNIETNPETFEWIWSSPFARWLSNSDGLFWIQGKPASGKSTLIRHVSRCKELTKRLYQGVETEWIVIHYFFDFRARKEGNSVRNTFEGLLRSLLFQLHSTLADYGKNEGLEDPIASSKGIEQHWSVRVLRHKFKILLAQCPNPICIFVDGLDEYADGQDDFETQQWDLAIFLQEIAEPRTKLCIASRPESVFLSAFARIPTLTMQDFNHEGIQKYVDLTLYESLAESGFYENDEVVALARDITRRADGVFLWAHFAMCELRNGWARGEDLELSSLYQRLDRVPTALDEIYSRILKRLRPDDRKSACVMLQLVCFACRTLSLEALWAATMRAEGQVARTETGMHLQRFEARVLAITGGILEIFWGARPMLDDSTSDEPMSDRNQAHRETDGNREVYGDVEGYSDQQDYEDEEMYQDDNDRRNEQNNGSDEATWSASSRRSSPCQVTWNRKGLYVDLIHRTVQDFLDSKGWSELADSARAVATQPHIMWLLVCSQELFGLDIRAEELQPAESRFDNHPDNPVRRFTSSLDNRANRDYFMSDLNMQKLRIQHGDGTDPLLQQYAALFVLHHASNVEKKAGVSSYDIMHPSMTDSFLRLHKHYWVRKHGDWNRYCEYCHPRLELTHPLHLAITHGLVSYVSDFLASNENRPLPEAIIMKSRFIGPHSDEESVRLGDYVEIEVRVGLQELAVRCHGIYHTHDTAITIPLLAAIFRHRAVIDDAAIVVALQKSSNFVVIQWLLQRRSAGPIILAPPGLRYSDAFEEPRKKVLLSHSRAISINTHDMPQLLASQPNVGPLWIVARRHPVFPPAECRGIAAILEILITRGEDINGTCGPFGTALHAVVSQLCHDPSSLSRARPLLDRGADVNASGPYGNPLEFLWLLLFTNDLDDDEWRFSLINSLLKRGAVNNQPDPNGMVPSRQQMLNFTQLTYEEHLEAKRNYLGEYANVRAALRDYPWAAKTTARSYGSKQQPIIITD